MSAGGSFVELPPAVPPGAGGPADRGEPPDGTLAPGLASGPVAAGYRGFFPFVSTSLSGLRLPFVCLLGYLLLQTTMFDEEWPAIGRFRPRLLLGATALLAAGVEWVVGRRERRTPSPEHLPVTAWLVAFACGGVLAMLWAFDPGTAKDAQLALTTSLLVHFLALAIVRTRREVAVLILVLVAGHGLYLLRSLMEFLAGKHQFTMGVSRMMGAGKSLEDPNSFAGTLAFSLPLVLWCGLVTRHAFLRLCVVAYGGLAAYAVVQTHSRSGLVLLVLNVLFALAVLRSRRVRLAAVAVLVALGVHLASGRTDAAMDRYASIVSSRTYTKESSTVGRVEGYRVAWRMFLENPLTGVGPGNWSAYRMRRVDGETLMPHNLAGQVIATYGLAGALPFVGFLAAAVALALRTRRRTRASDVPWDRAVADLALVVPFTLLLLLVSGLGAHNVERLPWYLMPALLCVAARAKDPGDPASRPSPTPTRPASTP